MNRSPLIRFSEYVFCENWLFAQLPHQVILISFWRRVDLQLAMGSVASKWWWASRLLSGALTFGNFCQVTAFGEVLLWSPIFG